jgi:hypothetical protein
MMVPSGSRERPAYAVQCECGKALIVLQENLTSGHTLSCGCLQQERASEANSAVLRRMPKLYHVWRQMQERCNNPRTPSFMHYGAKGVKVCDAWLVYDNFAEWASSSGYAEGLSIDRKESSGDYEPDNCRWITLTAQSRNKSNSRRFHAFGEDKLLIEWSEDPRCVVNVRCLTRRVYTSKWDMEKAITTPYTKNAKEQNR